MEEDLRELSIVWSVGGGGSSSRGGHLRCRGVAWLSLPASWRVYQSVVDVSALYRNVTDVLFFRTPSFATLCPNESVCTGSRGYHALVIANPSVMRRYPRVITGGVAACPPLVCRPPCDWSWLMCAVSYTSTAHCRML